MIKQHEDMDEGRVLNTLHFKVSLVAQLHIFVTDIGPNIRLKDQYKTEEHLY